MTTDRLVTTDIASQISKDISLYREKRQKKKYRTSDSFTKKEILIEIGVFILMDKVIKRVLDHLVPCLHGILSLLNHERHLLHLPVYSLRQCPPRSGKC